MSEDGRDQDRSDDRPQNGGRRSLPEWVSFGLSLALVLVLVGIFALDLAAGARPPRPVATVAGPTTRQGSSYLVPVDVVNRGDASAASVQVTAALEVGSTTLEADQTIPFLAGGEDQRLTFVFDRDPQRGTLGVRVASFAKP